MTEEGAMTAIVLDHEEPHEESRGRQGEEKAEPVAEIECRPHRGPEQDERSGRDDDLQQAAPAARLTVAGEDLCPSTRVARVNGASRIYAGRRGRETEGAGDGDRWGAD